VGRIQGTKVVESLVQGSFQEALDNTLRRNYTISNIKLNELGRHKLLLYLDPPHFESPFELDQEFSARQMNSSMHVFEVTVIPGWTSLMPTVVSLVVGWATGDVLLGLFIGCWFGGVLLAEYNPIKGLFIALDNYVLGALADETHAKVVMFAMFMAGMMVVIQKGGGFIGLAKALSHYVEGRRGVSLWTLALGFFVFMDGESSKMHSLHIHILIISP
jgi:hypothetical protein